MDDGRSTMDHRRWTIDDGRWTIDDRRWPIDDGRSTIDDGRSTIDDGRSTMDDGRSTMIDRPWTIDDVCEQSLPAVTAFLERHAETSLFMLSNIRAFGTRLGESLYSCNLKALRQGEEVRGVFCLTRGGSLLAQTGGDA